MTNTDETSFRNNSNTGFNDIEGEHFGSPVLNSAETASIFEVTNVSSEQKDSRDELSQNFNGGSANSRDHLQVPVIDKECDHNTVKYIGVDEGYNHGLEKCELVDSTKEEASDNLSEVYIKRVGHEADVNNSLDFGTLLDLAETGNNPSDGISDCIVDKSYLDEVLASTSNPFLEDAPVETCTNDEKETVDVAHPCNPFDFQGRYTHDGSGIELDETSNKFSLNNGFTEGVISSKNPFLDTSSFKSAMNEFKEAEKLSGNNLAVEGAVNKETATDDKEKKTANDDQADVPSITPTFKMNSPATVNGSQHHHDPLESSFASVNRYPALVSYSGQIPFSGSMSLRSEGSATSNRSFAFPVLQTEWKASPVRMAKANRKHRSLKHILLCRNF